MLASLCGTTLATLAHHAAVGFLSTGKHRGWSAAALAVRAALPASRPEPPAELPAGARVLAALARARYEQARQPELRGDHAAAACALLVALGLPHEATVDAAFAARKQVLEGEPAPDDELAWLRLALTVWEHFAAYVTLWG